ncbi:MAG: hypothetical protein FJY85_14935 [Deltaproteobacteria bacterium]|nr:hypothetical protein [Deltaproteobacteria bacterium]
MDAATFLKTFQFSPPNLISDFIWGRHHKTYISYCKKTCSLPLLELTRRCGFAKVQKLERRRRAWDEGVQWVPLAYLQGLGVDMDLMKTCVDLDVREHEAALELPRFPECFTRKLMPAVYQRMPFPEGITEDEAIEIVRDHAQQTGFSCWIPYPPLLNILISPQGSVYFGLYTPQFLIKGRHVYFGDNGMGFGFMSVR